MAELKKYKELGDSGDWPPEEMEVIHSQFPCQCAMCTAPIPEDKQLKDKDGNPMPRKKQWHIQLKPTTRDIGGTTGAFHEFVNESDRKESLMGVWLKQLEDLGVNIKTHEELKGHRLLIKRDNIEFDRTDGTVFVIEDKRIPVGLPESTANNPTPHNDQNDNPINEEFVPDPDFGKLHEILTTTGTTRHGIGNWARDNKISPEDLTAHMTELKEAGKLIIDDNGLYMMPV